MKKVLVVTSEYKYSGPNNVIKSLCQGMQHQSDVESHVFALRKKQDVRYVDELSTLGVLIHKCQSRFVFFSLLCLLLKLKPDAVNTHGIRADMYMWIIAFFIKVKVVTTVHNVPMEDYTHRYGKRIANMMLLFHFRVFKSKRIVKAAVSKNVANRLLEQGARNIQVVYNGVSASDYMPVDQAIKDETCLRLKLAPRRFKIVFCGHLTPLKDPLILARVAEQFPTVDFVFLGNGELHEELSSSPDNVKVLGRVNNVADYLSVADAFAMPSLTEGMPMALIEAFLMDLPAICSDIPIFKELSQIEGVSMYLFQVSSENELKQAITQVVNFEGVIKNREIAQMLFTNDVMAAQYTRIFNA